MLQTHPVLFASSVANNISSSSAVTSRCCRRPMARPPTTVSGICPNAALSPLGLQTRGGSCTFADAHLAPEATKICIFMIDFFSRDVLFPSFPHLSLQHYPFRTLSLYLHFDVFVHRFFFFFIFSKVRFRVGFRGVRSTHPLLIASLHVQLPHICSLLFQSSVSLLCHYFPKAIITRCLNMICKMLFIRPIVHT
jgi:hypothetical protein